ncbi:MAG: Bug family tripartite tricarboxylate transporter substrate binding protein [Burkholderiaceae bacterium]
MSCSRVLIAALAMLVAGTGSALAQTWPSKPVRLVVPYGVGGSVDVLSRHFANELGAVLKQTVVVENRPGASTGIGATVVAQSPADGYTILVGTASTMSTNPYLFSKLTYQPSQLEPIAMLGTMPLIVVGSLTTPKTFKELLAYAKANPGKLNYGTVGPASLGDVIGQRFMQATTTQITPVAYKGHAQAIIDMKGERLELLFDGLSSALPHVEAGGLRAFALIAEKRSAAAPQVPTMLELGFPTMTTAFWIGLFAPAGVPGDVVEALNAAVRKASQQPAMIRRFQFDGIEPSQFSVTEFKQFVARDQQDWKGVLANNKKLD